MKVGLATLLALTFLAASCTTTEVVILGDEHPSTVQAPGDPQVLTRIRSMTDCKLLMTELERWWDSFRAARSEEQKELMRAHADAVEARMRTLSCEP